MSTSQSGAFGLELGQLKWHRQTPAVGTGGRGIEPVATTVITQQVTTTLRGVTPLSGGGVTFATRIQGTDPETSTITAGYYLADDKGERVAPAMGDVPLGMPLSVSIAAPNWPGGTATWQVVVTIWERPATAVGVGARPRLWHPGVLTISLSQPHPRALGGQHRQKKITLPAVELS